MTSIDYDALRGAAEAVPTCGMVTDCKDPAHEWFHYGELQARFDDCLGSHETAEYLALVKPSVALALLDEVSALRKMIVAERLRRGVGCVCTWVYDDYGVMTGPDSWFDRTICPDPCGDMHYICVICSRNQDSCALIRDAIHP